MSKPGALSVKKRAPGERVLLVDGIAHSTGRTRPPALIAPVRAVRAARYCLCADSRRPVWYSQRQKSSRACSRRLKQSYSWLYCVRSTVRCRSSRGVKEVAGVCCGCITAPLLASLRCRII
jgi:hypothetical protein